MPQFTTLATALLLSACFNAGTTMAAAFVPPGVAPGDSYHLAFISAGARDATSSNIADYNAFVNAQAAANPTLTGTNMGVSYFAIASTPAIHANVNAVVSAAVYNFNGDKVADGFTDLWDGTLDNAVLYDQFANQGFPDVWTGTQANGQRFAGNEMGSASPRTGLAFSATSNWISDAVSGQTDEMRIYGLSEELVAPQDGAGIPEPTAAVGLAALFAATLTTRRRSAAGRHRALM